jgi:hypothetical protein
MTARLDEWTPDEDLPKLYRLAEDLLMEKRPVDFRLVMAAWRELGGVEVAMAESPVPDGDPTSPIIL